MGLRPRLTFEALDRVWKVFRVRQKTVARDHGNDSRVMGDCDEETGVIRIATELDQEAAKRALLHEQIHASIAIAFNTTSAGVNLGSLEEPLVEAITPHLYAMVSKCGYMEGRDL